MQHLLSQKVPLPWVNALNQSIIANFALDLRVGAFFDFDTCMWPSLAKILIHAEVPTFFLWKDEHYIQRHQLCYPDMKLYTPSHSDRCRARIFKPQLPNIHNLWQNTK